MFACSDGRSRKKTPMFILQSIEIWFNYYKWLVIFLNSFNELSCDSFSSDNMCSLIDDDARQPALHTTFRFIFLFCFFYVVADDGDAEDDDNTFNAISICNPFILDSLCTVLVQYLDVLACAVAIPNRNNCHRHPNSTNLLQFLPRKIFFFVVPYVLWGLLCLRANVYDV